MGPSVARRLLTPDVNEVGFFSYGFNWWGIGGSDVLVRHGLGQKICGRNLIKVLTFLKEVYYV